MDRLHVALIVLLGISIVFLGIGFFQSQIITEVSANTIKEEPKIWSTDITPDHLNKIADNEWLGRLKLTSTSEISGDDLLCLNICGNRCIWLGYSYESHSVYPGSFLWGDKVNPICSCSCYIDKKN
jgi:hypothetical protein